MDQQSPYCQTCGTEANGVFCPACGEKVKREKSELSFSYFIKDALEEVFNLDSKLFRTLRLLITKPGFLTIEALAGRRVRYIKPFRLFAIIVLVHFLSFNIFRSGDVFAIDRFPLFRLFPETQHILHSYEVKSGLDHEAFSEALNPRIKDNLNIIFNFLVFGLAFCFRAIYFRSGKYYIEHLYFLFHLLSFGLIRNIAVIPLVMMDLMFLAYILSIITQLSYTYVALRNVYQESIPLTAVKVVVVTMGFLIMFLPSLALATAIGIWQIL